MFPPLLAESAPFISQDTALYLAIASFAGAGLLLIYNLMASAKHKAELERWTREEAERREDEERRAREESERKARDEAARKAKDEAARKAKEQAARKEKEEAERKAREKEEAERKAMEQEEAGRKAKEKEEAERKAREEADQREETARKAKEKEEAERKAREKEEAERKAREKEEAERKAKASPPAKPSAPPKPAPPAPPAPTAKAAPPAPKPSPAATAAPAAPASHAPAAVTGAPRKILLVEDSVTMQKAVTLTLACENVVLTTVAQGAKALEQARELKPHLVIADASLNDKDGFQICRELRADDQLKTVPLLLLHGSAGVYNEARAKEVGVTSELKKPFDTQELIDKVRELVA